MAEVPNQHVLVAAPAAETTPLLPPSTDSDELRKVDHLAEENRYKVVPEMKILTIYTLPIVGTSVLEYGLVLTSVIALGHLSTTALAGSSLGSMTAAVTGYSIVQGLCSALDTVLPSAWTSDRPDHVGLWTQRMGVLMAIICFPILALWLSAEPIFMALKQDPEVAYLAAQYLRWVSWGLPAYCFNSVARRYFQAQGLFSVPTRIVLITAPVNVLLVYLLVWGPDPIRLGFIGAPISTALSVTLSAILSAIAIYRGPRASWHPVTGASFRNLGLLLRLGMSGIGQTASEWWCWELTSLAASRISPTALAAQSVLLSTDAVTFQIPFSLSIAAAVRIGNLLGLGEDRQAKTSFKSVLVLTMIVAAFWSVTFVIGRHHWGRIFNNDPEVLAYVSQILPIMAGFYAFDCISAVSGGVLRAQGKQHLSAFLNIFGYYVMGIPFGLYMAFKRDMGLVGLWFGLCTAVVSCATISFAICLSTDWKLEVQRAGDRLKEDGEPSVPIHA